MKTTGVDSERNVLFDGATMITDHLQRQDIDPTHDAMTSLPVQPICSRGSHGERTRSLRSWTFGAALGFHKDVTLAIYSSRRGPQRREGRTFASLPPRRSRTSRLRRDRENRTNLPLKAARRGESANLALHLRPLERSPANFERLHGKGVKPQDTIAAIGNLSC